MSKLAIVVLSVSIFLRIWQLHAIPPGLHSDEADMLYAAYSIEKTGVSQYGNLNPLAIREHSGGTHPPLYTYSLMGILPFFGLNAFAARLPSALFGFLVVYVIYDIARLLKFGRTIALFAMILATFNPWLLHISRQGLLEVISVFFVTVGIRFLLAGLTNPKAFPYAAVFLGLSLFSYDAPKLFVLPFLLLFGFVYKTHILRDKRRLVFSLGIIGISFALLAKTMILDREMADFTMVSNLSSSSIADQVNSERTMTNAPLWASSIFHNKLTVAFDRFITSYAGPFSLSWFFVNGDGSLQRALGRIGQFFLFEAPLCALGILELYKKRRDIFVFLLGWLLLGAIPPAVTAGHYSYRGVLMLPAPILLSAYGASVFWHMTRRFSPVVTYVLRSVSVMVIIASFSSLFFTYFYDYPVYASDAWSKQQNDVLRDAVILSHDNKRVFINGRWINQYAVLKKTDPTLFQRAYTTPSAYASVSTTELNNVVFGEFSESIRALNTPDEFFPASSIVVVQDAFFPFATPSAVYKDPDNLRVIFKLYEIP